MKNFLAHTDAIRKEMLESISKSSVEELFSEIPTQARMAKLELDEGLSEMVVQKKIKSISSKNNVDYISFIGGGVYNHYIPAAISQVAQRWEFLTAYTPYQPEISQGTLQIMYEFQTMICRLTGMDISNASVYDGAEACAEAVLMSSRVTKKYKALISENLNPEYKKVIETYAWAGNIELDTAITDEKLLHAEDYACILVQNPDFYGRISDIDIKSKLDGKNCLLIICTHVSSLSVLKSPAEYGADIVVGDIQPLGIPMEYGGAHAGFIACREKYMRQLAGRLAGMTVDAEGKQAFTLTIQTREQHIKRQKATSNICSNQALVALCSTLYLTLVGEKGFRQAGVISSKYAHELSKMLENKGIKILYKDFYNEFVIEVKNSDEFLAKLKKANILGGLRLDENRILVATTEMNTVDELKLYVENV